MPTISSANSRRPQRLRAGPSRLRFERFLYGFTLSNFVAVDRSGTLSTKKLSLAERGLRPLTPEEEEARVAAFRALKEGA